MPFSDLGPRRMGGARISEPGHPGKSGKTKSLERMAQMAQMEQMAQISSPDPSTRVPGFHNRLATGCAEHGFLSAIVESCRCSVVTRWHLWYSRR